MKNMLALLGLIMIVGSTCNMMHRGTKNTYKASFEKVDLDKIRGLKKDEKGRYYIPTGIMKPNQYYNDI